LSLQTPPYPRGAVLPLHLTGAASRLRGCERGSVLLRPPRSQPRTREGSLSPSHQTSLSRHAPSLTASVR